MYMGRTITFTCPHCGGDTLAQVDHGPNDGRCEHCGGYYRYRETDDGWEVSA